MGMIEIKRKLAEMEKHGSRLEVYGFLRNIWNERKDTSVVFLILTEMVSFLLLIESTADDVVENEDELYRQFFEEAVEFGYQNCMSDKLFLWLMMFYFLSYGTYYYVCKTSFCTNGPEDALRRLKEIADRLFPNSMMFKLFPSFKSADPTWVDKLSESECRQLLNELRELRLQNNYADEDLKELFMLNQLEKNFV